MAEDIAPRTFTLGGSTRAASGNGLGNSIPGEKSGRRAAPQTPKSQRPMAAKGDVDKALALLDTMYGLIGDGMDLFSLEETKERWDAAVTKLRRTNRDSLSASPKLAKSIANIGEGGGATTFFVAHVIAFATLYPTARREMLVNMAGRPAKHAAPNADDATAGFDWTTFQEPATGPGGFPTTATNVGEFIPGVPVG